MANKNKKPTGRTKFDNIWPGVYAIFSSIIFTSIFYPGFMSYDTLHSLRAARGVVSDSIWPPMVSYVWRLVDFVSTDPSAMHSLQVSILFVSATYIVLFISKRKSFAIATVPMLLITPVIIGTLCVIWKDVLTSAFMLAGFALALLLKRLKSDTPKSLDFIIFTAGLGALFVGISSRHNSISGALPFIFFIGYIYAGRFNLSARTLLKVSLIFGVAITALLYGGKTYLDAYSLPENKPLAGTDAFRENTQILDLAGASVCSGKNYMNSVAPGITLAMIKSGYDPRHVNLSVDVTSKVSNLNLLNDQWLQALRENPICILYQRAHMTAWMTGLNLGDQFLITAPAIDENEYGYALPPNGLRDSIVQALILNSNLIFFRPWFLALLATSGLLVARRSHFLNKEILTLYISGALYAVGLFVFGNAADARLLFHANVAMILVIVLTWLEKLSLSLKGRKY